MNKHINSAFWFKELNVVEYVEGFDLDHSPLCIKAGLVW